MPKDADLFLLKIKRWVLLHPGINGCLLVGSHARGTARLDSDIDLVLLASHPEHYLKQTAWVKLFGTPLLEKVEDYGKVQSLRVVYSNGLDVEFGFTRPDWAAIPLDSATKQVLNDGAVILFEKGTFLRRAIHEATL